MINSETLAEYHECMPGIIDRRFELLPDRVQIRGTILGTRLEVSVMLDGLHPSPDRYWQRTKHNTWSGRLLLILTVLLIGPFIVLRPAIPQLIIGGLCYLGAVIYFIRSLKRVERAVIKNIYGIQALDFWKAGPDAASFDQFLSAIETQIARNSGGRELDVAAVT